MGPDEWSAARQAEEDPRSGERDPSAAGRCRTSSWSGTSPGRGAGERSRGTGPADAPCSTAGRAAAGSSVATTAADAGGGRCHECSPSHTWQPTIDGGIARAALPCKDSLPGEGKGRMATTSGGSEEIESSGSLWRRADGQGADRAGRLLRGREGGSERGSDLDCRGRAAGQDEALEGGHRQERVLRGRPRHHARRIEASPRHG